MRTSEPQTREETPSAQDRQIGHSIFALVERMGSGAEMGRRGALRQFFKEKPRQGGLLDVQVLIFWARAWQIRSVDKV